MRRGFVLMFPGSHGQQEGAGVRNPGEFKGKV